MAGVTIYETPSTPPTQGKPQYPKWLWLLGLGVVLVIAGAVTALAFLGEDSGNDARDAAIEQFFPTEGDKIFQQAPVGLDLEAGFDASLSLNGVAIPEDQLAKTPALNLVLFTPGPDKEVEQYDQGQNCVVATFWPQSDPAVVTSRSWCFTVI
jgi:hypothetical protein